MAAVFWDGGAGTNAWDDADNWDTKSVPTIDDDVTINGAAVAVDQSLLVRTLTLSDATLDFSAGYSIGAHDVEIGTGSAINAGSNAFQIHGRYNNRSINVGGHDPQTWQLVLTDAELDRINTPHLTLGDDNDGWIVVRADISLDKHLSLVNNNVITIDNAIALNGNNFSATSHSVNNEIGIWGSNSLVNVGGTITLDAARRIRIGSGARIQTTNSDIILRANVDGLGQGEFNGITVEGQVRTTGSGSITIEGRGGNAADKNLQRGVMITGNGIVDSTATSNGGSITITGYGGAGTNTNIGVDVTGNGTTGGTVRSASGDISVTGHGNGTGNSNLGVSLFGRGSVRSTGTGANAADIHITGYGAGRDPDHSPANNAGEQNDGVRLSNRSLIESQAGDMFIAGVAGEGTRFNHGVNVQNSAVHALGSADITINGNMTAAGAGVNSGSDNFGFRMSSARVETNAGNISINGVAGVSTGSNASRNVGAYSYSSQLIAQSGDIAVTGTGGHSSRLDYGVDFDINNSVVIGGVLTIDGTAVSDSPGSDGVRYWGGSVRFGVDSEIVINGVSQAGDGVDLNNAFLPNYDTVVPDNRITVTGHTEAAGFYYDVVAEGTFKGRMRLLGDRVRTEGEFDVPLGGPNPISDYHQIVSANEVVLPASSVFSIHTGEYQRAEIGVYLVDGYEPPADFEFVIVDNQGTEPIARSGLAAGGFGGRFRDQFSREILEEGDLVTVMRPTGETVYFVISYSGGDGNDVALYPTTETVVTTTADTGPGSLRDALLWASEQDRPHVILFDLPVDSDRIIHVTEPLPAINFGLIHIDGTFLQEAAGETNPRPIELRGNQATLPDGSPFHGLSVTGGDLTLEGLVIRDFSGHGVFADVGESLTTVNVTAGANGGSGFFVAPAFGDVTIFDTRSGTTSDGLTADGNAEYGLHLVRDDSRTDDSDVTISSSVFSANVNGGLFIDDQRTASSATVVYQIDGTFGLDASRQSTFANGEFGARVVATGEAPARIVGDDVQQSLIVGEFSGNQGVGLWLENTHYWTTWDPDRDRLVTAEDNEIGIRLTNVAAFPSSRDADLPLPLYSHFSLGTESAWGIGVTARRNSQYGVLVEADEDGAGRQLELGGQFEQNGTGVGIHFSSDYESGIGYEVNITGRVTNNLQDGISISGAGENAVVRLGRFINNVPDDNNDSDSYTPQDITQGGTFIGGNRGSGLFVDSDGPDVVLWRSEVIEGHNTFSSEGSMQGQIQRNNGAGIRHTGTGENLKLYRVPAEDRGSGTFDPAVYSPELFSNGGLSIDLREEGPSENTDTVSVHPVITSANLTEDGFLDITGTNGPDAGFFLQFYATTPTLDGRGNLQTPVGNYTQLNGTTIPQDVLDVLPNIPARIFDQDFDPERFRFCIDVGTDFDRGLLTAVVVDPTLGRATSSFMGVSELAPMVPIGTQLTALPPILDVGSNERISADNLFTRTVSFRDEDSKEFEIVVDYGTGDGFEPIDYRRADRTIFLEHEYPNVGDYLITLRVLDDTRPIGQIDIESFTVTVENTPPDVRFNEFTLTKRVNEGETVDLTGFFDDLNVADNHTVTIDWGDGTSSQQGPLDLSDGNNPEQNTFDFTHVYQDDGVSRADSHVYRVVANVVDEHGGVSASPVFLIEVDNVLPEVQAGSLNGSSVVSSMTIDEGGSVTLFGSLTDVGLLDSHDVWIDWGDGSARERVSQSSINQNGALRTFEISHVYRDNSLDGTPFEITWTVEDDDAPGQPVTAAPLFVTVSNVAPIVGTLELNQPSLREGLTSVLFIPFADPGTEARTAIVNWGDGNITTHQVEAGAISAIVSHRYLQNNNYTISATVNDGVADSNTVTLDVTITDAPITVGGLTLSATEIDEGESVTVSGTFSSESPRDTYTVFIDWGNDVITPAQVDNTAGTFTATYRYDDGGTPVSNFLIEATVTNGTTSRSRIAADPVKVSNVAPTADIIPGLLISGDDIVLQARAFDPSFEDSQNLTYAWTVVSGGLASTSSGQSLTINPALLSGTAVVTLEISDNDGGSSQQTTALLVGTSGADNLIVSDAVFLAGINRLIVAGLGGNDVLDASAVSANKSVILIGGSGDDLLFDGAGDDIILLSSGDDSLNLPLSDAGNTASVSPSMGGNDEIFLIPNSTLTAYDSIGQNTLNFSLADSAITQTHGITFDLDLTVDRGSAILSQDVAPGSDEANTHFVAALGTFSKLVGSNYGDKLTGASNASLFGGDGEDEFFTKSDLTDTIFNGGDDADVLTARGVRVSRISFRGDDGADQLFVDAAAEVLDNLDFDGGNDADLFVNRGRVARIVFTGGADADVLQNLGLARISRISFKGDDGLDQFINEEFASVEWQTGDDPALQAEQGIEFDGGSDADLFINRGRVSRIVFTGGADADLLHNQKGRISRISFEGDDGLDQFINEEFASVEWQTGDDPALQAEQGIEFDGGSDADLFINRGRVSRIVFTGGADADLLHNQKGRISRISFKGDGGLDQFINEEFASVEWQTGDDPALQAEQGIEFDGGSDADLFINRGRVSRVVFTGGADADLLHNQKGRISRISFKGDGGLDRFINEEFASVEWQDGDDPALQAEQGIEFDGGNDADLFINRGRVSRVVFTGGADADLLQNAGTGRITRISFQGDDGADTFINEVNAVVEWQTGDDITLQANQGLDFDGGGDADLLINRGRVSRIYFRGGADEDVLDLQSGEVTLDVLFEGGDDADVLIARGRVGRIRFDGDAGDDEFLITGTVEGSFADGGLVEFYGGDDADLLVTRGTLRRLVFIGGADDNVLQTVDGSIAELEFTNNTGVGILVNRVSYLDSLIFTGGADADMFINRGENIGTLTFTGHDGSDVFVNSASTNVTGAVLTFDAGDGSNAMRNEGTGWAEVIYTGGTDADFLQNNAANIGELNFSGGRGSNALENNSDFIADIMITGSEDDDIFANDGNFVSGITFNGLNGNNTLINTGNNVSEIQFNGGDNNDRFVNTGSSLSSSTFDAGAGDDRFINYGSGLQSVTVNGGTGADWFINQESASFGDSLTFNGGDDDDIFVNLAPNLNFATFNGGAGDDAFQNSGESLFFFQFTSGAGDDLFLNLGDGANFLNFEAGDGDDIFENRGASGGDFEVSGGAGDDAVYLNAGYVSEIRFEGGDGNDTLLNFISGSSRSTFDRPTIVLDGGAGDDILQNSGNSIKTLELIGGTGKNTLQNFGHTVGTIRVAGSDDSGSDDSAGSFDTLLNSGSSISLIVMESDVASTLISSGNDIGEINVSGSQYDDNVSVSGSNVSVDFVGNGGHDVLLANVQSGEGSWITFLGGEGDDVYLFNGTIDSTFVSGEDGDDQVVVTGSINNATFSGGLGDDLYRFYGNLTGDISLSDPAGQNTTGNPDDSQDTLDFSGLTIGPISIDLATYDWQQQYDPQQEPNELRIRLTDGTGSGDNNDFENVIGTAFGDTILGNARDNILSGGQYFDSATSSSDPVEYTKTQWVYLDFSSHDDPGEYTYSPDDIVAVRSGVEAAYAGFDVRFVTDLSELPASVAADSSQYATILFNETPSTGRPGGEASEIDFGNASFGGIATVQVNGLLGGREVLNSGLVAVAAAGLDGDEFQAPDLPKPAATVDNFVALSIKIAAHELAHLLGLRHYDAFGPIGFGINAPPGLERFKPNFAGIAGAFETANHLTSSPASAGTDRFNDLRALYFGEREAIKLAMAFSDPDQVRLSEPAVAHNDQATALPLNPVTINAPNLATRGLSENKTFHVQATSIIGAIGLTDDTSQSGTSESDWYSFAGNAGDVVTIEVMSRALRRYYESNATSIDSVLRLYDATGALVQTFGKDAVNDDEFESSDSLLMDIRLPDSGTYFIEVDTFRRAQGDASYDAAIALRAELESRRDDTDPANDLTPDETQLLERLADSLDDTDVGNYELLFYRATSANASDGVDTIAGREGVDVINGGENDDYSIQVEVNGQATIDHGTEWAGDFIISDRGGFSWTATIDYGDGSDLVTMPLTSVDQPIDLSHVYSDLGTFTVTVTITNDDGLAHSDSFEVAVESAAPATVTGFDVNDGMENRSAVKTVDVAFSDEGFVAELLDSLSDGNSATDRIRIERRDLAGNRIGDGEFLFLSPSAFVQVGSRLIVNFGAIGLQLNGVYIVHIDMDDDLSNGFDEQRTFHRLVGDVNGDGVVNNMDLAKTRAAYRQPGLYAEADVDGDGDVDALDLRIFSTLARTRFRDRLLFDRNTLDD